jgi:predicted esterase
MPMSSRVLGGALLACLYGASVAHVQQPSTSSVQTSTAVPEIPSPSGPFGIGRFGCHWTDTSRPDDYEPKRQRELMVYFSYPTAKSSVAKGQYLPGAAQMDALPEIHRLMSHEFGNRWTPIVSGEISSHAIDHAPIASSRTPFPVVTFSHGLGSTGFQYTVLIEYLVSHGYVVASIEHTYTAEAIWFPDGRVITQHSDSPPDGLSPSERLKWMMSKTSVLISEGAADVRFVIDRMTRLNRDKKQFALAGMIDLERIAAMGHSAGAEFAARACQQDSRIQGCVDLDGGMYPWARFRSTTTIERCGNHCCSSRPTIRITGWAARPIRLRNTRRSRNSSFSNCVPVPTTSCCIHRRSLTRASATCRFFSTARMDFPKPQSCYTTSISSPNSFVRFSTRHFSARGSHCSMAVSLQFRKLSSRRMATDSDTSRL